MNDRLPYEEQLTQQWNDLPLPDENMAWADMERRLEDDDDNGIIPIWLRSCGLWSLVAIVLLGLGWWFFREYTSNTKKEETKKVQPVSAQGNSQAKNNDTKNDTAALVNNQQSVRTNRVNPLNGKKNEQPVDGSKDIVTTPANGTNKKTKQTTPGTSPKSNGQHIDGSKDVVITPAGGTNRKTKKTGTRTKQPIPVTKNKTTVPKKRKHAEGKDNINIISAGSPKKTGTDTASTLIKDKPGTIPANPATDPVVGIKKTDSTQVVKKDSVKKKPPVATVKDNTPKKDSAKEKSISFSAGIAMHQLIPIDGQKFTPYASSGRKGSLADYIPSVYFRMYKDDKWFLQSEFRYGAPQYTPEFLYQQKGILDTSGNFSTITSTKLKKTFYHQLPLTFNYFILPNWSVGTGFVWNKFNSAVSERDVVKHTVATGNDTVVVPAFILRSAKADTNFAKSYFQAVIETQYKWKRFSLGARYSFGLQPYLTFTLPGGTQQREKNKSLQLFLRYELWKSKKIKNKPARSK